MPYVDPFEIDGTPQEVALAQAKQTAELAAQYRNALEDFKTLLRNSVMQDAIEVLDDIDPHLIWEMTDFPRRLNALHANAEAHVTYLVRIASDVASYEACDARTEAPDSLDEAEASIA